MMVPEVLEIKSPLLRNRAISMIAASGEFQVWPEGFRVSLGVEASIASLLGVEASIK